MGRDLVVIALLGFALTGCGGDAYMPDVRYRVGQPYTVDGYRYVPDAIPNYEAVGMASWYGDNAAGSLTASGRPFDPGELTVAHKTLPFGTVVRVRRLDTGEAVKAVVTDRGPFVPGRVIDLSPAAARAIGMLNEGVVRVRVVAVGTT